MKLFNTNKVFSEMSDDFSAWQLSDNGICTLSNNTPTIAELYEGCSHLGDHITYDVESDKLYIECNGSASGFSISLTEDGQYKTMLYYVYGHIMGSGYYYTKTLSSDNICELLTLIGDQILYDADNTGCIHAFFQALKSN